MGFILVRGCSEAVGLTTPGNVKSELSRAWWHNSKCVHTEVLSQSPVTL